MILTWGEIEWDKYLSRYIYVHMNGYSPPVKTQGLEFDTLMWHVTCVVISTKTMREIERVLHFEM